MRLGIKTPVPTRPADLAYSDNYASSGSYTQLNPQPEYALTGVNQGQTYQPHWCADIHALRSPWSQTQALYGPLLN